MLIDVFVHSCSNLAPIFFHPLHFASDKCSRFHVPGALASPLQKHRLFLSGAIASWVLWEWKRFHSFFFEPACDGYAVFPSLHFLPLPGKTLPVPENQVNDVLYASADFDVRGYLLTCQRFSRQQKFILSMDSIQLRIIFPKMWYKFSNKCMFFCFVQHLCVDSLPGEELPKDRIDWNRNKTQGRIAMMAFNNDKNQLVSGLSCSMVRT